MIRTAFDEQSQALMSRAREEATRPCPNPECEDDCGCVGSREFAVQVIALLRGLEGRLPSAREAGSSEAIPTSPDGENRKQAHELPPETTGDETLRRWQPIESAPKDGTEVLVFDKAWCGGKPKISVSKWQWYRVISNVGKGERRGAWSGVTEATHWMPLPDPPASRPSPEQA